MEKQQYIKFIVSNIRVVNGRSQGIATMGLLCSIDEPYNISHRY